MSRQVGGTRILAMWLLPLLCSGAFVIAAAFRPSTGEADSSIANPARNYVPSQPAEGCAGVQPEGPCMLLLEHEIDAAREVEDVAPITLPAAFPTLSAPEQLLALADLERIDRGLSVIAGLSPGLDEDAQRGAEANADPNGPEAYGWGSNWSGSSSSLYNDLAWMYDDGPGSYNLDCRSASDSGCWGHRENILGAYEEPLGMGAGSRPSSQTQLFVSAYTPAVSGLDPVLAPTWASLAQTLNVGVSASSVVLSKGARSAAVELWASGEPMNVGISLTAGWTVSPTACQLPAGSSCDVTLSAPPNETPTAGGMTLSGPNGSQTIALARHLAQHLTVHHDATHLRLHRTQTLTGKVTPAVAGQHVTLQIQRGRSWHSLTTIGLGSSGSFRLKLRATSPGLHRYRVIASPDRGYEGCASPGLAVRVTYY